VSEKGWPRVWPVLLSLATGAIGLAAGLASKH
jgi:hypothetical protein